MLGHIRSALFIDFENMTLAPDDISSWLPWHEDGVFDHGKRRRFALKRVYWNSSAQRHEAAYKANGFEVVHCDRYVGLGNSVDIRMAIDIVETTYQHPRIDEYILVTQDSDYVPVLRRLRELHKRTAFVVDERRPFIHTTYRSHADSLISVGELASARRYVRPDAGFVDRLVERFRGAPAPPPTTADKQVRKPVPAIPPQPAKPTPLKREASPALSPTPEPKPANGVAPVVPELEETIAKALACVIEHAQKKPNKLSARAAVLAALQLVPTFATSGSSSYLGHGSYEALMRKLATLDPRLVMEPQNSGGFALKFVPPPEASPEAPRPEPIPALAPIDRPSADSNAA